MFSRIALFFLLKIGLTIAQSFNSKLTPSNEAEFCYEYLGCFNQSKPFDEFKMYKESEPDIIKPTFSLYTFDEPNKEEILSYKEQETIRTSSFNRNLPLKVIVHGYGGDKTASWLTKMKDKLFNSENLNIMIVSWGDGAQYPDYDYAAANSRVVGRALGLVLNRIKNSYYSSDPENFSIHCIGHSLGAHICGYAAELSEVFFDRITGLDPANKYFENTYHTVRVDPRDAKFVDIIHTDIGKMESMQKGNFGIMMRTGTVDFYVNGGTFQPGCPGVSSFAYLDPNADKGCSHRRAIEYFIESIDTTCPLTSFKCDSWENYQKGNCRSCRDNGCSILGYLSDNFRTLGSFYIATRDSKDGPYCGVQYLFNMKISSRSQKTAGKLFIKLDTGKATEDIIQLTDTDFEISPRNQIQKMFVSLNDISTTEGNQLRFEKKSGSIFFDPNSKYFSYDKLKIEFIDIEETYSLCLSNRQITTDRTHSINLKKGDCQL